MQVASATRGASVEHNLLLICRIIRYSEEIHPQAHMPFPGGFSPIPKSTEYADFAHFLGRKAPTSLDQHC